VHNRRGRRARCFARGGRAVAREHIHTHALGRKFPYFPLFSPILSPSFTLRHSLSLSLPPQASRGGGPGAGDALSRWAWGRGSRLGTRKHTHTCVAHWCKCARAPRGALVRARAEGEARTLRHRPFPKRAVGGGLQAGPEQETQPPVWDGPMGTRCQPKASTSVACHGAACAAWGPAGRFIRRAVRGPLQLHAGRSGIK
jgi:hypothetical protein